MDINGSTNVDSLGGTPLNRDNLGLIQEWHWKFAQSTNLYTVTRHLGCPLEPKPCLPPLPHGKDKTLQRREFRWVALLRQSPVLQYLKGVAISTHEGILLRDVTSFTPFISFHYIRNYAMTNHMLNFAQGTRDMFKAKSRFNPLRFNKCPCFRCVFVENDGKSHSCEAGGHCW